VPIHQKTVPMQDGYDFGVGVDLLSLSPMAKVVNDVHSGVADTGGATVEFHLQRILTTSELEQALQIDVDASYGSAMFGAGIEARFDFAKTSKVQTSSLFMTVTTSVNLPFLSIDDPALTIDAASLVDRPDVFEGRFGNVFVRGISRGGFFVGLITIDTESSQDSESISAELKGSYGLFSADAKTKFEQVSSKFKSSISVSMFHEGGPTNLKITDPTDPMQLLANTNAFLQSFQDQPNQVSRPYQATLASIAIARGPLPLNDADIQQRQDVLTLCAKRRSALLDQLNLLQFIVDKPDRFDFSVGASKAVIQKAVVDTQEDLDLIAACASAAINSPGKAVFPADFAQNIGGKFQKSVMPDPLPGLKQSLVGFAGTWVNEDQGAVLAKLEIVPDDATKTNAKVVGTFQNPSKQVVAEAVFSQEAKALLLDLVTVPGQTVGNKLSPPFVHNLRLQIDPNAAANLTVEDDAGNVLGTTGFIFTFTKPV
jgi:hypothetical protein